MGDDGGRKRDHAPRDETIEDGERNERPRGLRDCPKESDNSSQDNRRSHNIQSADPV